MSQIQGAPPQEPPPQKGGAKGESEDVVGKVVLGGVLGIMAAVMTVLIVAGVAILAIVGLVFFTCSTH